MEMGSLVRQNAPMATNGKRVITVGVLVDEETKTLLKELADEDARSISWIAHELLQRGIAAYRRDGMVREPEGEQLRPANRRRKVT